ncbi:MAG: hypothetical protein IGR92_06285 [Leptolyngbyaceae cyanobacterium T60_A2020_046]|nr:hypothetical protein [Leptolyngbyaceae cyanobacterium T60_A2020_046]
MKFFKRHGRDRGKIVEPCIRLGRAVLSARSSQTCARCHTLLTAVGDV